MSRKIIILFMIFNFTVMPTVSHAFVPALAVPAGIQVGAGAFAVGALAVAGVAGAIGAYDQQEEIKRYANQVVSGADAVTQQMIRDAFAGWNYAEDNFMELSDALKQKLGVLAAETMDLWAQASDLAKSVATDAPYDANGFDLPAGGRWYSVSGTVNYGDPSLSTRYHVDLGYQGYAEGIRFAWDGEKQVAFTSFFIGIGGDFTLSNSQENVYIYPSNAYGDYKAEENFNPTLTVVSGGSGTSTQTNSASYPSGYNPPATGTIRQEVTTTSDQLRQGNTAVASSPGMTVPPMSAFVPKNANGGTLQWDKDAQVYRNPTTGAIDNVATWDFPTAVPRTDTATGDIVLEFPRTTTDTATGTTTTTMTPTATATSTGVATGTTAIDYPISEPIPQTADPYTKSIFERLTSGLIGDMNAVKWGALLGIGETLTEKFPFSIPWDIGRFVGMLPNGQTVPIWHLTIYGHTMDITFPDVVVDWFPVIRGVTLVCFDLGILYSCYRMLGGAS